MNVTKDAAALIAISLLVVVFVSGCTNQGSLTGGVSIIEFGPDFSKVHPGETVNFRLLIQNTGSVKAENVFAELLGLDQDWYDPDFIQGGEWYHNEKLPNEKECQYTSGEYATLIPPDPVFGTGGGTQICTWTYKAPSSENVPRDISRHYDITARVFYDYKTEVVKTIPMLSHQDALSLKNQGKTIPLGDSASTRSPIAITVRSEEPIRLLNDGKSVEFPVTIDIQNTGGGTACIRGKCKKTQGAEWNKITLTINAENADMKECDEFKEGRELELFKGKKNSIKCYITISSDKPVSHATINVMAIYSYFIDKDSSITVSYE